MRRALAVALFCSCAVAWADDEPRTLVRARFDPPGPVVTGQTVRLVVDVLVTTFFTSAPDFPSIELPGAAVTLSDESAAKLTERIDGSEWFGLSRAYLLTPTAGGTIAVPSFDVTVHPGPGGAAVVLKTSPLSLVVREAPRPPGAQHAVGTSRLELTQTLDRPLEGLRAGDALTRTITVTADGARAMFLPPTAFPPIPGLAVYPASPVVEDVVKDRVGFAGGRRVDAATYVVQAAGRYELPAVSVPWWDTGANQLRTATAPALVFTAVANPDRPELALPPDEVEAARGSAVVRGAAVAGMLLAGLLAMRLVAPFVRRGARLLADRRAERRARYEASEEWAFARLRDATRAGDAAAVYAALVGWLARAHPGRESSVGGFCASAGNVDLTAQCAALQRELFGGERGDTRWSGAALLAAVAKTRVAGRRRVGASRALAPLNPA